MRCWGVLLLCGFGGCIVGRLWSLVTVVLLLDTLLVLWCWVLVCCFLFVGWFWVLVVGWFAWMVLFGFDVILLSVVLILALWFWLGGWILLAREWLVGVPTLQ